MARRPENANAVKALYSAPGGLLFPFVGSIAATIVSFVLFTVFAWISELAISAFGIESSILLITGALIALAYGAFAVTVVYIVWMPFAAATSYTTGQWMRDETTTRQEAARVVFQRRRRLVVWAVFKALVCGLMSQLFFPVSQWVRARITGDEELQENWRQAAGYVVPAILFDDVGSVTEAFAASDARIDVKTTFNPGYFVKGVFASPVLSLTAWTVVLGVAQIGGEVVTGVSFYVAAVAFAFSLAIGAAVDYAARTRTYVAALES